jgi:hypothetical protein
MADVHPVVAFINRAADRKFRRSAIWSFYGDENVNCGQGQPWWESEIEENRPVRGP